MKKSLIASTTCSVALIAVSLTGCGAAYEGSGSKDAASAEQLAQRTDDPWAMESNAGASASTDPTLIDGLYTGVGKGMEGPITVTLLVTDGHITCTGMTQEGESQSRGGFEAIRDGRFAAMIDAAQGSDIDAVSGATITTAGVKQAVDDALDQAHSGNGASAATQESANTESASA